MAITGEGTYIDYHYTGGIQTFTVPITGLYQFEVWGAGGGSGYYGGPNGGWSFGCKVLTKGQVLYIVCGGAGSRAAYGQAVAGGYNGGGNTVSTVYGYVKMPGSGGGATHIATRSGLLYTLENYKSDVLIVAGGGGGSGDQGDYQGAGGTGGGVNGGNGEGTCAGLGGTQTAGGANGYDTGRNGLFGRAQNVNGFPSGGGGWYGGAGGFVMSGGGGGSGYVGGVPAITYSGTYYTPGMVNGNRAGNGMARIQLVKVQSNLKFNNITMEKVYFNNTKIEKVIYNGSTVYG